MYPMFPWVCTTTDYRRGLNGVTTSETHLAATCSTFLFLPQFVNWNIETHNTLVIIHLISLFSPKECCCKKLFNYKKKKKDYKICLILIVTAW